MAEDKEEVNEDSERCLYEEKVIWSNNFITPMAPWDIAKKCFSFLEKCRKSGIVIRPFKDAFSLLVNKDICMVIFAGDVMPRGKLTHLVHMCIKRNVRFIFVPRYNLARAFGTTRRPIMAIIPHQEELTEEYTEICNLINPLQPPVM